jgi:hypothetical protein
LVGPGYDYCTLRVRRKHIVTFATSERGEVVVVEQYLTFVMITVLSSEAVRSALPVTQLASPAAVRRDRRGRRAAHEGREVPLRRNS